MQSSISVPEDKPAMPGLSLLPSSTDVPSSTVDNNNVQVTQISETAEIKNPVQSEILNDAPAKGNDNPETQIFEAKEDLKNEESPKALDIKNQIEPEVSSAQSIQNGDVPEKSDIMELKNGAVQENLSLDYIKNNDSIATKNNSIVPQPFKEETDCKLPNALNIVSKTTPKRKSKPLYPCHNCNTIVSTRAEFWLHMKRYHSDIFPTKCLRQRSPKNTKELEKPIEVTNLTETQSVDTIDMKSAESNNPNISDKHTSKSDQTVLVNQKRTKSRVKLCPVSGINSAIKKLLIEDENKAHATVKSYSDRKKLIRRQSGEEKLKQSQSKAQCNDLNVSMIKRNSFPCGSCDKVFKVHKRYLTHFERIHSMPHTLSVASQMHTRYGKKRKIENKDEIQGRNTTVTDLPIHETKIIPSVITESNVLDKSEKLPAETCDDLKLLNEHELPLAERLAKNKRVREVDNVIVNFPLKKAKPEKQHIPVSRSTADESEKHISNSEHIETIDPQKSKKSKIEVFSETRESEQKIPETEITEYTQSEESTQTPAATLQQIHECQEKLYRLKLSPERMVTRRKGIRDKSSLPATFSVNESKAKAFDSENVEGKCLDLCKKNPIGRRKKINQKKRQKKIKGRYTKKAKRKGNKTVSIVSHSKRIKNKSLVKSKKNAYIPDEIRNDRIILTKQQKKPTGKLRGRPKIYKINTEERPNGRPREYEINTEVRPRGRPRKYEINTAVRPRGRPRKNKINTEESEIQETQGKKTISDITKNQSKIDTPKMTESNESDEFEKKLSEKLEEICNNKKKSTFDKGRRKHIREINRMVLERNGQEKNSIAIDLTADQSEPNILDSEITADAEITVGAEITVESLKESPKISTDMNQKPPQNKEESNVSDLVQELILKITRIFKRCPPNSKRLQHKLDLTKLHSTRKDKNLTEPSSKRIIGPKKMENQKSSAVPIRKEEINEIAKLDYEKNKKLVVSLVKAEELPISELLQLLSTPAYVEKIPNRQVIQGQAETSDKFMSFNENNAQKSDNTVLQKNTTTADSTVESSTDSLLLKPSIATENNSAVLIPTEQTEDTATKRQTVKSLIETATQTIISQLQALQSPTDIVNGVPEENKNERKIQEKTETHRDTEETWELQCLDDKKQTVFAMCLKCKQVLALVQELEKKLKYLKSQKVFIKCIFCQLNFSSISDLQRHVMYVHLQCEGKLPSTAHNFSVEIIDANHESKSTNKCIFKCFCCQKVYHYLKDFKEHIENVHGNFSYSTDSLITTDKNGISVHSKSCSMRGTHKKKIKASRKSSLSFICDICSAVFKKKFYLILHMEKHTNAVENNVDVPMENEKSENDTDKHKLNGDATSVNLEDVVEPCNILTPNTIFSKISFEDDLQEIEGTERILQKGNAQSEPILNRNFSIFAEKLGETKRQYPISLNINVTKKLKQNDGTEKATATCETKEVSPSALASDPTEISCDFCSKNFASQLSLMKHRFYFHDAEYEKEQVLQILTPQLDDEEEETGRVSADVEEAEESFGKLLNTSNHTISMPGTPASTEDVQDDKPNASQDQISGKVQKKWRCNDCKENFVQIRNYLRHKYYSHNDESVVHICENCNKVLTSVAMVNIHICRNVSSWRCNRCNLGFRSSMCLTRHNALFHFESGGPKMCNVCQLTFLTEYMVHRHQIMQHALNDSNESSVSGKCTDTPVNATNVNDDSPDGLNDTCTSNCDDKAVNNTKILNLETVLATTKPNKRLAENCATSNIMYLPYDADEQFKCKLCNLTCLTKSWMKLHLAQHHDIKVDLCRLCADLYVTNGLAMHLINRHIVSEVKETLKAKENDCKNDLVQALGLKRLLSLYEYQRFTDPPNEKCFNCMTCSKMFSNIRNYREHYLQTHDVTCLLCNAKFQHIQQAIEHKIKIHQSLDLYLWAIENIIRAVLELKKYGNTLEDVILNLSEVRVQSDNNFLHDDDHQYAKVYEMEISECFEDCGAIFEKSAINDEPLFDIDIVGDNQVASAVSTGPDNMNYNKSLLDNDESDMNNIIDMCVSNLIDLPYDSINDQ